uniref:Methylthioadenosine phosphorylase n=1 Tax=Pseudonaja textilis TaxID=8673 RepID=A0A670ZV47_PSETE
PTNISKPPSVKIHINGPSKKLVTPAQSMGKPQNAKLFNIIMGFISSYIIYFIYSPRQFLFIIFSFLCRTTKRHLTFYDGTNSCLPGVCHVSMAEPFCAKTREVLLDVAKKLGIKCHSKGTVITVEGPRFSSRAESLMFRSCGADVINMTTVPEVILAKEAGICYASIAMATDYDCWKEHEETVSVDRVLKTLKENANKATSLLLTAIPQIGSMEWSETHQNLKKYSLTLPRVITFEP